MKPVVRNHPYICMGPAVPNLHCPLLGLYGARGRVRGPFLTRLWRLPKLLPLEPFAHAKSIGRTEILCRLH